MTKAELQAMIAEAVAAAMVAATAGKAPVGASTKASGLSSKDAALLRGFKKKGIKDVVLMDRSNPAKPFNVRPFKGWLALGRIVRKGEHGVRGLFHVSQTDLITTEKPKASPKVETKAEAPAPKAPVVSTEEIIEAVADKAERMGFKSFAELAAATK